MRDSNGAETCRNIKLGLEQIDEMSDNGEAVFTKCATQLFDNYSYMQELISKNGEKIVKDGITISVTCKDSIQGAQRDCLKKVMQDVFREKIREATGKDVSNIECVVTAQSAVAEIAYAHQLFVEKTGFSGKIVVVDCGYSGLSICGGEMKDGKIALHTDVYSSGCGGEAINNAIVDLLQKRCDDAGVGAGFEDLLKNKTTFNKIIRRVESAKCNLSDGSDDCVELNFFEDNNIDDTITREQLNDALEKNGILSNLERVFSDYVQKELGGIGSSDRIVFTGASMRVPALQDVLKTVSKGAQIYKNINAEEAPASGAALLAGCTLPEVAEKA